MQDDSPSEISFYIMAHADDWQLFMQPHAYRDLINPEKKIVFIITTAGDAGFDEAFWLAREEGIKSSVRYCLAAFGNLHEVTGIEEFDGKNISYCSINNATCYFLRLPDGGLNGEGFEPYLNQSLSKLRDRQINSITTVEGLISYESAESLRSTIEAILRAERANRVNVSVHYMNPDSNVNVNDHADHIATGQLLQELEIISTSSQFLYNGYNSSDTTATLTPKELFWKIGMFAAYEKAVFDNCGYSTLKESVGSYFNWCTRCSSVINIKGNEIRDQHGK